MKNDIDAAAQFILSDEANEQTEQRSMGEVGQRNFQQADMITRPRPINEKLLQIRSENPFAEIQESGNYVVSALLDAANPQVSIEIPSGAKTVIFDCAVIDALNQHSMGAVAFSFVSAPAPASGSPLVGNGARILSPGTCGRQIWCDNKRQVVLRNFDTTSDAYVSAAFTF